MNILKLTATLFLIYTQGLAQSKGDLTILIPDIEDNGKGNIIISVFDSKDGFPQNRSKARFVKTLYDLKEQASHTFKKIPYGEYAVVIIQDKDEDGELDTNFFGIPSEPVGASYKSSFGKPSFDECSFELKEKKRSLRISFVN